MTCKAIEYAVYILHRSGHTLYLQPFKSSKTFKQASGFNLHACVGLVTRGRYLPLHTTNALPNHAWPANWHYSEPLMLIMFEGCLPV